MNSDQIEFNKVLGQNRGRAAVRECLRGGVQKCGCSGKIVHAHSIQRGKILEYIADNGEVYHLGVAPSGDMMSMSSVLVKEGIKKFSTFTGFCGGHDKTLFQSIEDVGFVATPKQLDIYAYRAAAKELHSNLESKRFCEVLLGDDLDKDDFPAHFRASLSLILSDQIKLPGFIRDGILKGARNNALRVRRMHCESSIAELRKICDSLICAIDSGLQMDFEHMYYCFDGDFKVACSTSFIPYFDHEGVRIISHEDEQLLARSGLAECIDMKNALLNVFPEAGKTHVIFTFSKGNVSFKNSLGRLFGGTVDSVGLGLSNMLLNYSENVALGPRYIDGSFGVGQIEEIKNLFSYSLENPGGFRVGAVNLFSGGLSI